MTLRSGFKDSESLSFGDHIIEADEDRNDFSGCRRSHRNFHFHGFDKGYVVAFANVGARCNSKRADAAGYLGDDPDFSHCTLRGARHASHLADAQGQL